MLRHALGYSLVLTVLAAACSSGGNGNPTGPTGNGNAAITATVNGAAWGSTVQERASYDVGAHFFNMTGQDGKTYMTFGLGQLIAPGTYSVAYGNVQGSSVIVTTLLGGWNTALPGGTGTITFTTFTSNHAVGTFSFTAVTATSGATGKQTVTSGKFDVTF